MTKSRRKRVIESHLFLNQPVRKVSESFVRDIERTQGSSIEQDFKRIFAEARRTAEQHGSVRRTDVKVIRGVHDRMHDMPMGLECSLGLSRGTRCVAKIRIIVGRDRQTQVLFTSAGNGLIHIDYLLFAV